MTGKKRIGKATERFGGLPRGALFDCCSGRQYGQMNTAAIIRVNPVQSVPKLSGHSGRQQMTGSRSQKTACFRVRFHRKIVPFLNSKGQKKPSKSQLSHHLTQTDVRRASRTEAKRDIRKNREFRGITRFSAVCKGRLTLAELRRATSGFEARFLAFFHSRVAGKISGLL